MVIGIRCRESHGKELGQQGEEAACQFLQGLGYQIVARNYRTRSGEIDIIGKEKDSLVFIEVKTRRSEKFGLPWEAVDSRKQAQISRVALEYISRYRVDAASLRFDVVGVIFAKDTPECQLIRNAFEAVA